MKKLDIVKVKRVYDCDDGQYKHHASLEDWTEDLVGRHIIVNYPRNTKILGKIIDKNMYEALRILESKYTNNVKLRNRERYFWLGSDVHLLSKSEESGFML